MSSTQAEASSQALDTMYISSCIAQELMQLKADLDLEKYLKQGAECSYQMMKEEYVRVTTTLLKKYTHDTQQLKNSIQEIAADKTRESKELKTKLEKEMSDKVKRIEGLENTLEESKRQLVTAVRLRDDFEQKLCHVLAEKRSIEEERDTLYSLYSTHNDQYHEQIDSIRKRLSDLMEKLNISIVCFEQNDESKILEIYFKEIERTIESERQLLLANIQEETKKVIQRENKIQNLEAEMIQMKKYYDTLENALKTENLTLKGETIKLKSDFHKELNNRRVKDNIDGKTNGRGDQHDVLLEAKFENKVLNDEIKNLKSELEKEINKLNNNQRVIENLESNNANLKKEYDVILNEVKMENLALKDKLHSQKVAVSSMTLLNEKLETLQNTSKTLERQNAELLSKNEQEQGEKLILGEKYRQSIRELKTEVDKCIHKNQEALDMLIEHERLIESISKDNDILRTLVRSQTESIEILKIEKKTLSESLQKTNYKLDNITGSLKCEKDSVRQLKEKIGTLQKKLYIYEVEKQSNELTLAKVIVELDEKRSNEIKFIKHLQEIIINLKEEVDTVHNNEKVIQCLGDELFNEISHMKVDNSLLQKEISNLREMNAFLMSDVKKFKGLNTDVLILEDNLRLTLDMNKLLHFPTEVSSVDHSTNKTQEINLLEEMHTLVVQQLEQKNEILQTKLQNTEFELRQLRKVADDADQVNEKSLCAEMSDALDSVVAEISALKKDLAERDERDKETRRRFEQEKDDLEASIQLEVKRNENILASMETLMDNYEQKSAKMKIRLQEEKWRTKQLVEMLGEMGIKIGNTGGDQTAW